MCRKVSKSKNISIIAWNVNGLYRRSNGQRDSKLEDDSIDKNFISDIVCLSETHATKKDILEYPNYKCYSNYRPS